MTNTTNTAPAPHSLAAKGRRAATEIARLAGEHDATHWLSETPAQWWAECLTPGAVEVDATLLRQLGVSAQTSAEEKAAVAMAYLDAFRGEVEKRLRR